MLIDKAEIIKHREISKAVRDDKINPHITDAEELDLAPLLGELLYNAIATTPGDHAELLEGGAYAVDGVTYTQPGLNKVLAIFAYSRYILFGSFTDTAFGFVEKSNQDSQPVGGSSKKTIYTKERQTAEAYFSKVGLYLTRKDYTNWNSCDRPASSGLRISKITL